MDLIASFHSHKIKSFHFFSVTGLLPENESLFFLFDTGAVCPVVGINSFFDKNNNPDYLTEKEKLECIVKRELSSQQVVPRQKPLKAANNKELTTYPCMCKGVSISNTKESDFYFDISFDEISIPLLGSSFIDDCSYSHSIGSSLSITAIKDNAGSVFYSEANVLDFNVVLKEYSSHERDK